MKNNIFLLMAVLLFIGCDEVDRVLGREGSNKTITYSYACLDSAVSGSKMNRRLEKAGDLIRDIAVSEKTITDSVQNAYGKIFHEQMVKEGAFKFINDASLSRTLDAALEKILAARDEPSGITYSIYALEDSMINAFTFGGYIYITRGMLQKCEKNDALLYAILGHEIGHSELGHIKATIQDLELSNKIFGDKNGATFFELTRLLTASFNQRNELEADYYGINLTNDLNYDVCTAVSFWKEMASNENSYNKVEDFFRTHPFSELRSECLTAHINTNFNKNCGTVNKANSLPQVVD